MRLYRENRRSGGRTLLSAAGMAALLGIFWAAFGNVGKGADAEQFRMTEEAIRRAAVNCYAIEGSYPQNLGYLIEHYGVQAVSYTHLWRCFWRAAKSVRSWETPVREGRLMPEMSVPIPPGC